MLEVTGLEVRYGAAPALSQVDLRVGKGEVVSVVGPNGAGKTTLVNAVAGLLSARSGEISMDGVALTGLPGHRFCEAGLAVVPEGRRVFSSMSVEDNLAMGAYRRSARRRHQALRERVYELFPRLGERSSQRAGTLSGGEQQMLSIGRALMADPRLLLMDEPSLGLAPVVVDQVFEAIGEINRRGVSILLVEQNVLRALEVSVRGYLLGGGRVVLEGTAASLRDSDEVRRVCLGI